MEKIYKFKFRIGANVNVIMKKYNFICGGKIVDKNEFTGFYTVYYLGETYRLKENELEKA